MLIQLGIEGVEILKIGEKQKEWIARLMINFIATEVISLALYLFNRIELTRTAALTLTLSAILLTILSLYLRKD